MPKATELLYSAFTSAGVVLETPSLLFSDGQVGSLASVGIFTLLEQLGLPIAKFTATNDSQTITEWSWATYSFANRTIATNTGIKQPNTILVNMYLQPKDSLQMLEISTLMLLFKNILDKYIARGGLFTCVLPSMTYLGCALQKLESIDSNDNPSQIYKFTFTQPLVSASALNNLINDSSLDALDNGGVI